MSEINANIVVQPNNLNITPTNNQLNITPEAIQLNIMTGSSGGAGTSNNGELLFNNVNSIGGVANTSYASGNLSLGNVANVRISGGTNGYVLQTDGTGNLNWAAGGGVTGNGVPGGAVNQIQYNLDGANFGGSTGFSFNPSSNLVSMPGNLTVVGNIAGGNLASANFVSGTLTTAAQPNITSVGNLTGLTVVGTSTIQQAKEKVELNAVASTGTVNFELLDSAILYKTSNSAANFTINIRGNVTTTLNSVMSNGQSLTCSFLNTNGTPAYYANTIQIDGNIITPKWIVNGIPSGGTLNGIDVYTFNIIKIGTSVFTVLGSKVGFQ